MKSKLYIMIMRQIVASIFFTLYVQIPYLICAVNLWLLFMARHLLLVVTSLECVVTLTTNNSNCILDPICALNLEVRRQFVTFVFGIHL